MRIKPDSIWLSVAECIVSRIDIPMELKASMKNDSSEPWSNKSL